MATPPHIYRFPYARTRGFRSSGQAVSPHRYIHLTLATKDNIIDYAVEHGEFMYQASTWSHRRRVVFKIAKPYGQFVHMYIFVVTTMEMSPDKVIQFYCGRGKMENLIKEAKRGFDFSSVSSHSCIVNVNRVDNV
jgi:hypothetical protein